MCKIPCFPLHHKIPSNFLTFESLTGEKKSQFSNIFLIMSQAEHLFIYFRDVYFLFCRLIIVRIRTVHLHTQLGPELKLSYPHTYASYNLQCRPYRLHYSLVFPGITLLFQDMPFQANNLIIHYRTFPKDPSIL